MLDLLAESNTSRTRLRQLKTNRARLRKLVVRLVILSSIMIKGTVLVSDISVSFSEMMKLTMQAKGSQICHLVQCACDQWRRNRGFRR